MYFVDNSAHIFQLPDYSQKPIGYEFDEQDYIFWFNDTNNNTTLSVNNYYGKIINVLFEINNVKNFDQTSISLLYDIEITCDSENYKLIKAVDFQNAINNNQSILDYVNIQEQKKILTSKNDEDILVIKVNQDNKNYIMIPIYIIGISQYPGTWLTNILIHISNKFTDKHTYCPITIGGVFNSEYESLIIHGKNMGINLPKEILKAINGTYIDNDSFNEELYNKKIKEYLLNYINIKGELGNYKSAIHSLKWFDYQDSVNIYKLLETDNNFITTYIRDFFDIKQDIIEAYSHFLNTQFIGLNFKLNKETDKLLKQNINNTLWGEGLPELINTDEQYIFKNTDEYLDEKYINDCQQFKYISPYLKYSINDLMFKLSYLKYYYQNYFLPIFIILKDVHLEYKVYANPNKYLTYTYNHYYEQIINTQQQSNDVIFNTENNIYFTHQNHFVDKNFNEFENSQDNYEINDTCLYIPIKFKENKYYNCILLLKDEIQNEIIYKSTFAFLQSNSNKYLGFVFYPKMINELININLYTFINKSYTLYLNVNNKWYEYKFITKLHELDVHIGTLEYKYWLDDIKYLNNKYHDFDESSENNEVINNSKIIFTFHNNDNIENNVSLDITDYIDNNNFFDNPTKYFSNFSQIKDITDNEVIFNTYMHQPDFIYLNNINFGLYQKNIQKLFPNIKDIDQSQIDNYIKDDVNNIIQKYQSDINIINNYKYLNNVHLYYLYKPTMIYGLDILKYKNDLSILCDQILIEHYLDVDNENINEREYIFKFTKVSDNNITNEDELINHYLLDDYLYNYNDNQIDYSLKQNPAYYFILERQFDANGNYILTGNSANTLFSLYEYTDDEHKHDIGCIFCPIINNQIEINNDKLSNGQYVFNFENNYKINNLKIISKNNKDYIIYTKDNVDYPVYFTFDLYIRRKNIEDQDSINNYTKYNNDNINYNEYQLYGKLNLFHYDMYKVLNLVGYYNTKFCNSLNVENQTCNIDFSKIGLNLNINYLENVNLYKAAQYVTYNDIRYANQQTINSQNISLYWITYNNDDIDMTINQSFIDLEINPTTNELKNKSQTKYINYLYQDITGLSGTYKITYDTDTPIKLVVNIDDELYYDVFTLTGSENKVFIYFEYNPEELTNESIIFKPHIYQYIKKEESIVEYNSEQNLIDFYKYFFEKKYSIKIINNEEEQPLLNMWDLKFQFNNNYDSYLMHDNDMWYFVFISKDTCNNIDILNSLNTYPEYINFGEYTLKHISTKQLFLINRMDINYKDNIYHFDSNNLIVCSLYNNKMLPHNLNITSKWELIPLSFSINKNHIIYANTNTAIISINNLNSYDKGYYKLQVNYALDNNIVNTQTINKKILIQ